MLYGDKEKINSEVELIVYWLKWYSQTSIISLALLVLRPKLVLLLTDVLSELSLLLLSASAPASASARRLLYFRDTGSHVVVVRATIQHFYSLLLFSNKKKIPSL